jgi:hypothetical protein
LKSGDVLLIQGMHFKIVVGEDILDIIEEFEGENDQSDDEYESPDKGNHDHDHDHEHEKEREGLKRTATRPLQQQQPHQQPLKSKSTSKVVSKSESMSKSQSLRPSAKDAQQQQPEAAAAVAVADTDLDSVDSFVFDKKTGQSLRKAYTMLPLRSASRGVIHHVGDVGPDHIKLDRVWLFDDAECVDVHRVSKKPSYAQPFFEVSSSDPSS